MRILYNNLWDIAKAVLRGKLIAVNTYTRIYKRERSQITLLFKNFKGTRKRAHEI